MCGIIGFVGKEPAAPILLEGLERMEYRGYDSAGVAVRSETAGLQIRKTKGRLKVLSDLIHGGAALEGELGLRAPAAHRGGGELPGGLHQQQGVRPAAHLVAGSQQEGPGGVPPGPGGLVGALRSARDGGVRCGRHGGRRFRGHVRPAGCQAVGDKEHHNNGGEYHQDTV